MTSFVQSKGNRDRRLEMEIWHDLANVYVALSQWQDAEVCLAKSEAINPYSAPRWHTTGILLIFCFMIITISALNSVNDYYYTLSSRV